MAKASRLPAVTEENEKCIEPLGRCHPTLGFSGCWDPRVFITNLCFLSACIVSAW